MTKDASPSPSAGLGRLRSSHGRGVTGAIAIALGRRSAVDVHENGLAIWDTLGRRIAVPFGEIDAIYYEAEGLLRETPSIVLVTFSGARVRVPSDVREIGGVVQSLDRCLLTARKPR